MRFATFVFLTLYLFTSSMAYAILPAGGVIAGGLKTGGVLVIRKGAKAVILGGGGIVGGMVGDRLVKWCKSNKKKCAEKIGEGLYDTIFGGDDDDDCPDGQVRKYASHSPRLYNSYHEACFGMTRGDHPLFDQDYITIKKREVNKLSWQAESQKNCRITYDIHFVNKDEPEERVQDFTINSFCTTAKDDDRDDKERERRLKKMLMDALKDKLDDEEFTQIVNNYGDKYEFELTINKCTGDNSCIEIEPEFADKINNRDYDPNKMSRENCEVRNNKIVSCDKAKRKKKKDKDDDDDDDKDEKKKDKDDDDDKDKDNDDKKDKDKKDRDDDDDDKPKTKYPKRLDDDDDDKPLTCDSSKFHKKVCDWIDWTQDDQEFDDDGRVKPDDLSKKLKIDDDKIRFNRACPSGENVRISFGGITITHQISYDGLCQAFSKMRPFVVGMGFVVGGMIIGGRRV